MRVHIAEFVEGRGRVSSVQGSCQRDADEEGNVNQAAHVLENIARVYGFALLILVPVILFAAALSFLECTTWPDDGSMSPAMPTGNRTTGTLATLAVPNINQSAWSAFLVVIVPAVAAMRIMFATSCGDPYPLPGKERFTWKYAPQYVFKRCLRENPCFLAGNCTTSLDRH